MFSPSLPSEIHLFPQSIFCSSFSFYFNNFAHCLQRSRFLSLNLSTSPSILPPVVLYFSLHLFQLKSFRSISPYSVSTLFVKSSSHPRSHSLSQNFFHISFLFCFLSVISIYTSPSPFFFRITYYFGVSLCICRLLASLLPFLSSALPPLFLFFFISKIQFSLPLISSRISLYLSRNLLFSLS